MVQVVEMACQRGKPVLDQGLVFNLVGDFLSLLQESFHGIFRFRCQCFKTFGNLAVLVQTLLFSLMN